MEQFLPKSESWETLVKYKVESSPYLILLKKINKYSVKYIQHFNVNHDKLLNAV